MRFRVILVACAAALAVLALAACGEEKKDETPAANQDAPAQVQVINHDDQSALSLGQQAPEFTLPIVGGGSVRLSSYRGEQPVLLFFHMAVG